MKPVVSEPAPVGCELYRNLIAKYDWNVPTMMAIMQAESSCRPNSTGDTTLAYQKDDRSYGYSNGLLQVRILPGREHCDTHDPAINIQCGYNVYRSQGYEAWSVYTTGKYLDYLL